MLNTNFRLCWETFRNNLSDGFSKLQQMQEFVDVTLAAGGHFVKAHQNIIAVASPYLKEMMKSTPCQHPVIFLGPVNHTVLCFILEYIYTGEVNIPSHVLPAFVEAAKQLHIAGIKDIQLPQGNPQVKKPSDGVNKHSENISVRTTTTTEHKQHSESEVIRLVNNENINSDNYESTVNPDESLINKSSVINEKCGMDLDFETLIEIKNISIGRECPDIDTLTSQGDQPTNCTEATSQPLDSDEICDSELDFENLLKIKKIPRLSVKDTHTLQVDQPTNSIEENRPPSYNNNTCDLDLDFENLITIKKKPRCTEIGTLTSQGDQPTNTIEENIARNIEPQPNMETAFASLNNDCNDATGISKESKTNKNITTTPLYTRSNRGSLQMVLNRYVYYLHHTSFAKQKRRWRCIKYRKQRCAAYVDTNGEIITSRKNQHTHPFLDDEILKIGRRKQYFTSIAELNDRQHQETNLRANEIADINIGEQKKYEIKIEFGQVSIT